ncbi:MAG: Cys-tRNA(Pro) deacylase [Peptococcaceae bacterium]|nr:Cys-tRNA(Pro) deacylase [Peptococcaceae bacterium]
MAKTTKTNAARILEKKGIAYELLSYEVDEQNLGAEHVAELLNIPLEQAFKTLVLRGDKTGILVACVAGDKEINLKKLAALSKNKKVEMVPMKDILGLTGYIRGGVSPLGMKKEYPTFVDESMLTKEKIIVSAGQRGLQLYLKPQDLLQSISCTVGEITE